MINKLFFSTILFMCSIALKGQEATAVVTSSYIKVTNRMYDVDSVNMARNKFYKLFRGEDHPYQYDEIDDNIAFYKVYDKKTPPVEIGVLKVRTDHSDLRNKVFATEFNNYVKLITSDDPREQFQIELVTSGSTNAGYIIDNADNSIYFLVIGKTTPGFFWATLEAHLPSGTARQTFAADFIKQIKFK